MYHRAKNEIKNMKFRDFLLSLWSVEYSKVVVNDNEVRYLTLEGRGSQFNLHFTRSYEMRPHTKRSTNEEMIRVGLTL